METLSQGPNWPLIANLRPQLRQHVHIHPQEYRGAHWYILRDESSGRHLRVSGSAYEFIGRLDGDHSVEEVWVKTQAVLGEDAPSQDETLQILTQLFAIDLLKSDLPADAKAFFKRFQSERRLRRQRAIMNPLSIRVPLMDPDRILNRFMPWLRPLFSRTGAALWLLIVGFASLLVLANLAELRAAVDKDILAPSNLVIMLMVFVSIKVVHEFAHAFAVKMWGGEVHEMGVTLLVFVPVPYVDASAAWGFRSKYKRILVGAVGVLVELFIASIAVFVWLVVEPGLVRDAAFNALLIASVSTLLFNANPLLRFDGYYVLQDLIEIPNLSSRSSRYYLYLIKYHLFGLEQARSPVTAEGEAIWLAVYGMAACFYRLAILAVIAIFLAQEYLFIGVALGVWAAATQVVFPVVRGLRYLLKDPHLAGRRRRATVVTALLVSTFSAGLLLFPVPLTTHTEGIVWVSDQAQVYAGAEGFVTDVLVPSGTYIVAGTPLLQMRALVLETHILKLQARCRELELRSAAERLQRRVQSAITKQEIRSAEAELALLREQESALLVRSEVSGTFVLPNGNELKGRYLKRGDLIGFVFSPAQLLVRTIVPQKDIGLVQSRVEQVQVRFAERLGETVNVRIVRETPAGTTALPSRALGAAGGGDTAVRVTSGSGLTTVEKVFQVDLGLPEGLEITGVGERAYVRFDHGTEPLGGQWLRIGRQLVLSQLSF
jgi:putative peptide zinc metalloprotease protein